MREVTPAEVADLPIVDVREPHEWQQGHADGAIHIPMGEIVERLHEVPDGAAVICRSGARSGQVVAYLDTRAADRDVPPVAHPASVPVQLTTKREARSLT